MTKIMFSALFTLAVLVGGTIGVTQSYAEGASGPALGYCPDDPHSQFHDLLHCDHP